MKDAELLKLSQVVQKELDAKKENTIHDFLLAQETFIDIIRFSTTFHLKRVDRDEPDLCFNLQSNIRKFARALNLQIEVDAKMERNILQISLQIYFVANKFVYLASNLVLSHRFDFDFETGLQLEDYQKNLCFGRYIYESECNRITVLRFTDTYAELQDHSLFYRFSDFALEDCYINEFSAENCFHSFKIEEEMDFTTTDGAMQAILKRSAQRSKS